MKSTHIIVLIILALSTFNCAKDKTPYECLDVTFNAYVSWEQDSIGYPPGSFWNPTNDTIYPVSIDGGDYSTWRNQAPFDYCNCDDVFVDFSSSDSLIHVVLLKDGVIIDSTLNYGTRKFQLTESGSYDFMSVYLDTAEIHPFNSDTSINGGYEFTFQDCSAAN